MLIDALHRVHLSAQDKKWDKIYIAVDIHNTIVYGNYNKNGLPTEYISNSKEVLQYLSTRKDIVLIIYTCSHPSEITKYLSFFKKDSIIFKYANENLDIHNDSLGCYNKKIYFNLLLEDKAGFNAETDWTILYEYIKNINFNYDN